MERADISRMEQEKNVCIPDMILIEEILPRLPVKSICRFRSVCKLWRSLPHEAWFVKMHYTRSLSASNVIVLSCKDEGSQRFLSFCSLDKTQNGTKTRMICTIPLYIDIYAMEPSCRGLVCFSSLFGQEMFVGNPSTLEFVRLPQDIVDEARCSLCKVAGFGFDQSSKSFKVVCAFRVPLEQKSQCFIFQLGSVDGKWRQLSDIPYCFVPMQSAYLNGAVHWIIESNFYNNPEGILSFNFEDETYRVLAVPNCRIWRSYVMLAEYQITAYLKALGGYLRLFTSSNGSDAGCWNLDFWTLEDYESNVWTYEFMIEFDITCEALRLQPPVPVDIQNGKVLLSAGNKLYTYEADTKLTTKLDCDFLDEEFTKIYQANHVETLFSGYGRY